MCLFILLALIDKVVLCAKEDQIESTQKKLVDNVLNQVFSESSEKDTLQFKRLFSVLNYEKMARQLPMLTLADKAYVQELITKEIILKTPRILQTLLQLMDHKQLIVIWQPHLKNLDLPERSALFTVTRKEFMEWLQLLSLNGPHFISRYPEFPSSVVQFVSPDIPRILHTYGGHHTIMALVKFLRPFEKSLSEFVIRPEVRSYLPHIVEIEMIEMNSHNMASKMTVSQLANVVGFLRERDW